MSTSAATSAADTATSAADTATSATTSAADTATSAAGTATSAAELDISDWLEVYPVGCDLKILRGSPPTITSQGGYSMSGDEDGKHLIGKIAVETLLTGEALLLLDGTKYETADPPLQAHTPVAIGVSRDGLGDKGGARAIKALARGFACGASTDGEAALDAICAGIRAGMWDAGEIRIGTDPMTRRVNVWSLEPKRILPTTALAAVVSGWASSRI